MKYGAEACGTKSHLPERSLRLQAERSPCLVWGRETEAMPPDTA